MLYKECRSSMFYKNLEEKAISIFAKSSFQIDMFANC